MPLRKSPLRTPALVAAWRANARKSRGPKSFRGKALSSLNALKHGRYAIHLRRKLIDAGDRQGEALYARIEGRVAEAFCPSGPASPDDEQQLRRLTGLVWCFADRRRPATLPSPKTILECAMESIGCSAKDLPRTRIQVHDGRRRIGVVFWVQRRRIPGWNGFWKRFGSEFRRAAAGVDKAASGGTGVEQARAFDDARQGGAGPLGESNSGQTGSEQTGPEEEQRQRAAAQMGASTALSAAWELESGLRSRIFHLRRPNIWARLQYGLDRDGVYSPKLEAEGSRELKKLCLAGIQVGSWPPLLGSSPTINWGLIPFGFGKPA